MIYYLTETQPLFGNPWPCSCYSLPELEANYQRVRAMARYPKLFVCARTDTQSRDWPNERFTRPSDLSKVEFMIAKYVKEAGYRLVWENSLCSIYTPPEHK
jgi:hypothetical protein